MNVPCPLLSILFVAASATSLATVASSQSPTLASAATSRPASKPTPRSVLLEAAREWVHGELGPRSEVELNGTMLSFQELDARGQRLADRDLSPQERVLAIADEVLHDAMLDELRRLGAWDAEAAEAKFAQHAAAFDVTPFTTATIATRFKGFPSRGSYQRRFMLAGAFEDKVLGEVTDATLEGYRTRIGDFLADRRLGLELLRFDHRMRGGVAAARAAAQEAREAWERGTPFSELEAKSDATGSRVAPGVPVPLNTLRELTGDTEYARFVSGRSLADELFANAESGRILGPQNGVHAEFVVRIERADAPVPRPAKKPLDARTRELVRQILLEERFLAWSQDALDRAVLRVHRR